MEIGMNCEHCHRAIPDNLLDCPACTIRKNDKAINEYQLPHLRMVMTGDKLITRKQMGHEIHVQLFGVADKAFCGATLASKHKRDRMRWDPEQLQRLCPSCRIEVERAMRRAVKGFECDFESLPANNA